MKYLSQQQLLSFLYARCSFQRPEMLHSLFVLKEIYYSLLTDINVKAFALTGGETQFVLKLNWSDLLNKNTHIHILKTQHLLRLLTHGLLLQMATVFSLFLFFKCWHRCHSWLTRNSRLHSGLPAIREKTCHWGTTSSSDHEGKPRNLYAQVALVVLVSLRSVSKPNWS